MYLPEARRSQNRCNPIRIEWEFEGGLGKERTPELGTEPRDEILCDYDETQSHVDHVAMGWDWSILGPKSNASTRFETILLV